MQDDYNISDCKSQLIETDRQLKETSYIYNIPLNKINEEHQKKFIPKKINSEYLAESYNRLEFFSKANRVYQCGSYQEWKVFDNVDFKPKLSLAYFCKDPLCPMCAWRRSRKMFNQLARVMNHISDNYKFIFLTLTIKNSNSDKLAEDIDLLTRNAWQNLSHNRKFKKSIKGWYRTTEITHDIVPYITQYMYFKKKKYYDERNLNVGYENPTYNTYHAHIHVVLAVEPRYFSGKDDSGYITQLEFRKMWQSALSSYYDPWVHVQAIYDKNKKDKYDSSDINLMSAIAESAKYITKDNDYIIKDVFGNVDEKLTDESVNTLISSINRRQLSRYGGVMEKARKELNLDDAIDGDLVHIDNDTGNNDLNYIIMRYNWHSGYRQYDNLGLKPDINIQGE